MRRWRAWPLLVWLLIYGSSSAGLACERWQDDDRIGTLLHLVEQYHPALVSERGVLAAQSRQHDWAAELGLSYADKSTTADAQGVNTQLRVSIPLFDRKHELALATQRNALTGQTQQLREAFLADLAKLCAQSTKVRELDTQREFWRDRLKYQQQRVDEGLDESVTLWQQVEKSRNAEYDYQRENGELTAQLITISRQYGGKEWKRLQALLAAMLN